MNNPQICPNYRESSEYECRSTLSRKVDRWDLFEEGYREGFEDGLNIHREFEGSPPF
jgi:hypothetical protein